MPTEPTPEPTIADVLKAVADLRAATIKASGDQQREQQRRLETFQQNMHLEFRALDGRVAVVESEVRNTGVEVRSGFEDIRTRLDTLTDTIAEIGGKLQDHLRDHP
jgi:hypothetical protein